MSTQAQQLRDSGQDAVIAADAAVLKGHADYIRDAIDWHATHLCTSWTCDDVRFAARLRCEQDGRRFDPAPNLLPALMGVAVGRGEIVRLPRDATSTRRSRHSSRVGTYLGARYAPSNAPSVTGGPVPTEVEGAGGGAALPRPAAPRTSPGGAS